jgi:hypothetical protein
MQLLNSHLHTHTHLISVVFPFISGDTIHERQSYMRVTGVDET